MHRYYANGRWIIIGEMLVHYPYQYAVRMKTLYTKGILFIPIAQTDLRGSYRHLCFTYMKSAPLSPILPLSLSCTWTLFSLPLNFSSNESTFMTRFPSHFIYLSITVQFFFFWSYIPLSFTILFHFCFVSFLLLLILITNKHTHTHTTGKLLHYLYHHTSLHKHMYVYFQSSTIIHVQTHTRNDIYRHKSVARRYFKFLALLLFLSLSSQSRACTYQSYQGRDLPSNFITHTVVCRGPRWVMNSFLSFFSPLFHHHWTCNTPVYMYFDIQLDRKVRRHICSKNIYCQGCVLYYRQFI